eukprot:GHVL01032181.1.p1 GENE.GHVL01032181.1~~GHVL01032181.1.p1  ORF type:complete len:289 (-),score=89.03 GHVL01032181.1:905-1741(-)
MTRTKASEERRRLRKNAQPKCAISPSLDIPRIKETLKFFEGFVNLIPAQSWIGDNVDDTRVYKSNLMKYDKYNPEKMMTTMDIIRASIIKPNNKRKSEDQKEQKKNIDSNKEQKKNVDSNKEQETNIDLNKEQKKDIDLNKEKKKNIDLNDIQFSKLRLDNNSKVTKELDEPIKRGSKRRKLEKAVSMINKEKKQLQQLQGTEKEEFLKEMNMKRAIAKAEGARVKDDVSAIKKTMRRDRQKKQKKREARVKQKEEAAKIAGKKINRKKVKKSKIRIK